MDAPATEERDLAPTIQLPVQGASRGTRGARALLARALLVEGMGCAALVVVLSVAAWAAFLRGLAPSTFWDTPSFTDYAAALAHGRLPPVGLRLPGYPVFILLAGGRGLDLDRIVAAQLLLGVVANLMVFEVVRRLARSALAGLAAALVVLTFADLLFMGITVYSEPLCLFLVDAAALATVLSFQQGRRRWILGAAALWTGAALVRPIFLVAACLYLGVAALAAVRARLDRRAVAVACCAVAAVVLGVAGVNRARSGPFQFAIGSGLSLLNYVGHPSVYQRLPPEQAHVRELYARLARAQGAEWVGWWSSIEALAREARAPLDAAAQDRVARAVALRAIQAAPEGYLRVWRSAAEEFLSDADLFYGWFERPGAPAPQWPERSWRGRAALAARDFWREHLRQVTCASLLLPAAALALLAAARRRAGGPARGTVLAYLTLAAILAATVLVSTALEPWPGQMRYRYPVQHLHVVVAAAGAALVGASLLRLVRPRAGRGTSRRLARGLVRRRAPWLKRIAARRERGWRWCGSSSGSSSG